MHEHKLSDKLLHILDTSTGYSFKSCPAAGFGSFPAPKSSNSRRVLRLWMLWILQQFVSVLYPPNLHWQYLQEICICVPSSSISLFQNKNMCYLFVSQHILKQLQRLSLYPNNMANEAYQCQMYSACKMFSPAWMFSTYKLLKNRIMVNIQNKNPLMLN